MASRLGEMNYSRRSERKPLISSKSNTTERVARWPSGRMRRGEDARQRKRLAHATSGNDPGSFRSGAEEAAVEGAVVEIVSVVISFSPLARVVVGEENEQDAPEGRAVQENFTVPLYPPSGATVSVVVMVWPATIVPDVNSLEKVKSGMETTMETASEVLGRLRLSPE
jgi:hypothetical protein